MKLKPSLILYIGAGVFFFFFWFFIVFPYDALQSRVITEIENQTGGRYQLDMSEMDISLFGSVTFEDLKINERVAGKKSLLLKTPKFKIGFSPLGLISKKMDFDFFLEGNKKGEIEGDFRQDGTETEIHLELDEFPLEELKFLSSKAKVGLKGNIDGKLKIKFDRTNVKGNEGNVDLNFENVSTEPTSVALDPSDPASAMSIPEIKLSGAKGSHIRASVNQDRLDIQSIKLTGGDIDLDLSGRISLRGRSAKDFRLDIKGGFKVTPKLSEALPFLFLIEKQRNDKGVFPLTISGRIGRPLINIGKFRVPL